jgi:hypothetical protein
VAAVTTNKRPKLYFTTCDGTETASGTGRLLFPSALILCQLRGGNPVEVMVSFYYDAANYPAPSKGYIQGGLAMIGSAYLCGWQPAQNRNLVYTPNTEILTQRNGKRRALRNGPLRRAVNLSWTDGVDQKQYVAGTDDYILGSDIGSATPNAMRHDVIAMLQGLLDHLDGSNVPVVYCPSFPHITASPTSLFVNRCGGSIYGRLVGSPTFTTLLGEECREDVVRVDLSLEEEV